MEIDPSKAPRKDIFQICEKLLAPDSKYKEYVRADLGDRYCTAMISYLDARSACGISEEEAESTVLTGAKLQKQFTALVVDSLQGIRV